VIVAVLVGIALGLVFLVVLWVVMGWHERH
jgi:hypothetical protein